MNTAVREACVTSDLFTAEELLTRQINADGNDHNSYANRSFVVARKSDWDRALHDALRVRYAGLIMATFKLTNSWQSLSAFGRP
jgi:hypothetical protein